MAGLLFARALAGDKRPGWRLTGLGLALVTIIDPGFMPRISFSGYGESPLAVTLAFAGWIGAVMMRRLAAGERCDVIPLAAVLCAMVNAKQQAVGLFLATVGALFVVAALDPRLGWRQALRTVALAAVPGACLYITWAAYVHYAFPQGELARDIIAVWPWATLPQVFSDMGKVLLQKGDYAASLVALFAVALYSGRFASPVRETLRTACVVFALYTCFLVAMHLGWFEGAHSYFRYNTQLSLLIVLALALAARDTLVAVHMPGRGLRIAGAVLIAGLMIVPLAWPRPLRFDRALPQPWLRAAAQHLAGAVDDGARIAVILPGDNCRSVAR